MKITKWFFISFIISYSMLGYLSVFLVSISWKQQQHGTK